MNEREFKLPKGIQVADTTGVYECYSVDENEDHHLFIVNVSAEHIDFVFRKLTEKVQMPAFLVVEVGTNAKIENMLRSSEDDPFHRDVYYLDELKYIAFSHIYEEYKELLINDGLVTYGYCSHEGLDEVLVGPYKIFYIYTGDPQKYEEVLRELGFPKVENITTLWDVISPQNPGVSEAITVDGLDVYGMIERLKRKGLYLADRRNV